MADAKPTYRLEDMSNFDLPWCKALFRRPDFKGQHYPGRRPPSSPDTRGRFALIAETLWTDRTIRGWYPFTLDKPTNPVFPYTYCLLVALGDGLDISLNTLAGGITATIMDTAMSMATAKAHGATLTAIMEVRFKGPIHTPCVLVCKVNVVKIEGRKCFAESALEDGNGKIFATATATFVQPPGERGRQAAEALKELMNGDRGLARPKI